MTSPAGRDASGRHHSLAPAHLGEVRAGAALAVVVLGVAIFIAGVGVIVSGLSAGTSLDPANPPPNAAELGRWQVFGGIALFAVGILLTGGGLSLLSGGLAARVPTAVLALVIAVLGLGGAVFVVARGPSDLVLALTLVGLGLGLGVAGLLLLRPRP